MFRWTVACFRKCWRETEGRSRAGPGETELWGGPGGKRLGVWVEWTALTADIAEGEELRSSQLLLLDTVVTALKSWGQQMKKNQLLVSFSIKCLKESKLFLETDVEENKNFMEWNFSWPKSLEPKRVLPIRESYRLASYTTVWSCMWLFKCIW